MASIPASASSSSAQSQGEASTSLYALLRFRTIVGYVLLGATILFTFGAGWDVTSHRTVGRDATFSPAHVTMLTALSILGLAAMILVLVESRWVRRNMSLQKYGTFFAGGFFGPLGAYVTGFGAVAAAVAFPLDNYWHSLYGIDVSLWAPFHVMIAMGTLLSSIGATYLLLSTAHLARGQHAHTLERLCTIAAMITLADMAGKTLSIINPALSAMGLVQFPFANFDLYPILISTSLMIGVVTATLAFPIRFAATILTLIHLAINVCLGIAIPPVMAWQISTYHETLLPRAVQTAGQTSTRSNLLTSLMMIVLALVIDGIAWYMRHKGWKPRTLLYGLYLAALPVLLGIALVGLASIRTTLASGRLSLLTQAPVKAGSLGLSTVILSLLLLPLGELVGLWFAYVMGRSLQKEVR